MKCLQYLKIIVGGGASTVVVVMVLYFDDEDGDNDDDGCDHVSLCWLTGLTGSFSGHQ